MVSTSVTARVQATYFTRWYFGWVWDLGCVREVWEARSRLGFYVFPGTWFCTQPLYSTNTSLVF